MYWPVQRARLQTAVREGFQAAVGLPLERALLASWKHQQPGAAHIERLGLPRRAIVQEMKADLVVQVAPRELIHSVDWRGYSRRQRPSSSVFLWDGDWDLRRGDLRHGSRYRFISDLDEHRGDLTETLAYDRLKTRLDDGRPWRSHQQGILLDSEARILTYLRVYLSFLDDMTIRGFDASRGKDDLGVAVSREGRLIKINRGLHRLAMAQRIGLDSVPVAVKAVHRQWWEQTTAGATGQETLDRLKAALAQCRPETAPGPLDPDRCT